MIQMVHGFLQCLLLDRAWLHHARADQCVGRMQIHPWTIWLFWSSPLMYAMQALSVNEFTAGLHNLTEPALATEICKNIQQLLSIQTWLAAVGLLLACCHTWQLLRAWLEAERLLVWRLGCSRGGAHALALPCAARWQVPYGDTTVGLAVLDNRGLFKEDWWRWVGIAALLGFAILFNILVLVAQTYLGREPLPALPCLIAGGPPA